MGDIIEIDDTGLVQSFRNRIVPKTLFNVILIYNIENRTMKFVNRRISGLVIYPEDNETDSWRKLLGFVGNFIEGLIVTAR